MRRLLLVLFTALALRAAPPNIVFILADDMGTGDVKCFFPAGKTATPNLDRLAAQGMRLTDAHSGSAVCTPTRYGIVTGRYAWRSRLKKGVLGGFSSSLIEPDRSTVAKVLKQAGYRTACVGKWHLGMDWPRGDGSADEGDAGKGIQWDQPIGGGPLGAGFDEYFGISASADMPLYGFIRNDRVVEKPTTEKTFIRKGPAVAEFETELCLPAFARESIAFLERCAQKGGPFFLYLPLNAPHTPISPNPAWQGKSGLGPYGDFVMETDDTVGQVLAALDRLGLASNTVVFFSADNGCSPAAKIEDLRAKGHDPCAGLRGTKADVYEGGHRVPTIVRWPGTVPPGSTRAVTVTLTDFMATVAEIAGAKLPDGAAEDSVSFVPVLKGGTNAVHEAVIHHSINGSFAIRRGAWKLCACPGSGGWSDPKPGAAGTKKLPPVQLFNLEQDPAEQTNLQDRHPEIVRELSALLEAYQREGRRR